MALVFTEDQLLLRESAKEFLAQRANPAALRALRHEGKPFDVKVWAEMCDLGWSGIVVPEPFDGLDFGYVGAGILMEEMGRNLSMSPFFSTAIVGATALKLAGSDSQKETLLKEVAGGDRLLALAVDEGAHHDPSQIAARAHANDQGFLLSGKKHFVLDGQLAHTLLVASRTSGDPGQAQGITLFLVEADSPGVHIEPCSMLDHRAAASIRFDEVALSHDCILGELDCGSALLQSCLDVANICLAAELLGLAREAFSRTVAYLSERNQFDSAIGSFQALQHRAAHLFSEIELAKSIVLKALLAIDSQDVQLPALACLAKAKCCQVVKLATNEAIQMHGGIGMTDEFDLGFFIKRGRAARATYGDYNFHAERFARLANY